MRLSSSTLVLSTACIRLERFAALKIMTRQATSELKKGESDEATMLQKVASADTLHPGRRHVLEYYDTFVLDGVHICIVSEVLGPNLYNLTHRERSDPEETAHGKVLLPLPILKSCLRQILLGLDYLHTSCGIIHTGELLGPIWH